MVDNLTIYESAGWCLNNKLPHRSIRGYIHVKWEDGLEEWYLDGERHRIDGPALVFPNGTKHWYLYGKPHREDGPAAMFNSGVVKWFLNGEYHTLDEWCIKCGHSKKYKVKMVLKYG